MSYFKHMLTLLLISLITLPYTINAQGGSWQLQQKSIGISAMHMQLRHDDRVIIFDRTDFGKSELPLPPNQCRRNPRDQFLQVDCTAHSAEYNVLTNTIRPLNIFSDTWCSSGATLGDGTIAQTGGSNDGERVVRTIKGGNCTNCDWQEIPNGLLQSRWYASNHVLPDGSSIIIGGRAAFNYEFYPKTPSTKTLMPFTFLRDVRDPEENNLYPFSYLYPDGNMFVFANNRAVLFDYKRSMVIRQYPAIPGGDPRNYPSTGSAVLLPMKNLELGALVEVELLICGGAPRGSFARALNNNQFLPALNTCARMKISDPNPTWTMETMPMARIMGDMINLPSGDVIIINGAGRGVASWETGRDPILSPVIYHPNNAPRSRFEIMKASTIPRMYHSCAVLLADGRVLVGGSNPHQFYNFTNVLFPTELSLETFSPPYLDQSQSSIRPVITSPFSGNIFRYATVRKIKFTISGRVNLTSIKVVMIRPPFNTHSFSMGQRMLVLTITNVIKPSRTGLFLANVMTPGSANIAPPGYYMLFVVHNNVPSPAIWVRQKL